MPGSGPAGTGRTTRSPSATTPTTPRDPDEFERARRRPAQAPNDEHKENARASSRAASPTRSCSTPTCASRRSSPACRFPQRLFDAYKAEVARVDTRNGDGVISAVEGDVEDASDGFSDNARLFLPATSFDRFAVTREINDGLLAPRFAPSQRAWVLTGAFTLVSPSVDASVTQDADNR